MSDLEKQIDAARDEHQRLTLELAALTADSDRQRELAAWQRLNRQLKRKLELLGQQKAWL